MDLEEVRNEVETTYEKVKSLAGWTVDKHVVLAVTSYYITSERDFDAVSLNKAMDELKNKSNWLSPLRGNLLSVIAAFIDQPSTNSSDQVDKLFAKQRVMKKVGFRNTIHSYLGALLLTDDVTLYEKEALQAKKLYDAMKKNHYFLTSDEDYAYAVLLGKKNEDPVEHARMMRSYYDALRKEGFRSGNELQWLSQVMTYKDIRFSQKNVLRAYEILTHFRKETRVKPVHYPMIGFLTLYEVEDAELEKIVQLTHTFEDSKPFKWNKEMALSIAIGYYMNTLVDNVEDVSISFATSVDLILQAQQAIMAATMAAMVSTTNSVSNPT